MQRAALKRRFFVALTVLAAVVCLHLAWFIEDASRAQPEAAAEPAPVVRDEGDGSQTSRVNPGSQVVASLVDAASPPREQGLSLWSANPLDTTARPPKSVEPTEISPAAAAAAQEIVEIRAARSPAHPDFGDSREFAATLAGVIAAEEQAASGPQPIHVVGRTTGEDPRPVDSTVLSREVPTELLHHAEALERSGHIDWADRLRELVEDMTKRLPSND